MRIEPACRSRGFTLIETLVALLVFSIGMLGVAAMQLQALQSAHAAYQRSIASLAAQDAQERLWAEIEPPSGTPPCLSGSLSDVASAWRAHWKDGDVVTVALPGFEESTLEQEDDPECEFTITVTWDERRFGDEDESFVYTVRLPE